jgi:hypothetical protein
MCAMRWTLPFWYVRSTQSIKCGGLDNISSLAAYPRRYLCRRDVASLKKLSNWLDGTRFPLCVG